MGVSELTETGEPELRGIGEGKAKGKTEGTSTTSEESDLTKEVMVKERENQAEAHLKLRNQGQEIQT